MRGAVFLLAILFTFVSLTPSAAAFRPSPLLREKCFMFSSQPRQGASFRHRIILWTNISVKLGGFLYMRSCLGRVIELCAVVSLLERHTRRGWKGCSLLFL